MLLWLTLITEVFLGTRKMERKKPSEDIVLKSCWAWRNITLEWGWSPISSLGILIRRAPFWSADMHTVHAQEWREGLKPVTQPVWPVWLSKLLDDLSRILNRILTRFLQRFSFSLHFSRAKKNLCYQDTCGCTFLLDFPTKTTTAITTTTFSVYLCFTITFHFTLHLQMVITW